MNYNNIKNKINKIKYFYNIYECILKIIDKDINLYDKNTINEKSHIFKIKLANDLLLKHIYKKFDYKLKKQKNLIYNFLTINHINAKINNNIIRYISIYLNLNILIIKNNLYRFVNIYNKELNTIILIENNNNRYNPFIYITNNIYKNIFIDEEIIEILKLYNYNYEIIIDDNEEIDIEFNRIKKYNLEYLYKVCDYYNINIFYNTNKKKTKKQLFEELYNILYKSK